MTENKKPVVTDVEIIVAWNRAVEAKKTGVTDPYCDEAIGQLAHVLANRKDLSILGKLNPTK